MDLETFLATANADHALALEEARAYEAVEGRFITSNTLTVYVVQLGLYSVFHDIANTVGHPARDICMAVMDRLRGVSDFNFILGTPMGNANFSLLDSLIALIPEKTQELQTLKSLVTTYCNKEHYPFAETTLHEVYVTRDACPTKSVALTPNGTATITLTSPCESHNPRLMALSPTTNKWQRISNFIGVSLPGMYECFVPPAYSNWELAVDDPYGVI